MNTFIKMTTSKLKRGAYFTFMMTIYTLAMSNKLIAQKAAQLLAAFKIAIDHVDDALAIRRKSEYTDQIAALNEQRLGFLASLKTAVKTFLKTEATAEDAKQLLQLLKDYGITSRMQLDQLTGLFDNLMGDLEGRAATAVKALKLQDLVADIKQSQEELKRLTKERLDESTENGIGRLKDARAQADALYHQLLKLIEVLADSEGRPEYIDFIDHANVIIKHFKQQALGEKVKEKIPGTDTNPGGNDDGEEEPPQG
ncbi:MAG: DUF6261 family protein [Prevotellaceae bacterium]|jgi:DNA gyrase/topoisomerase IV subunit A|nr:DUF6261 family protein [Prevotellaceae bacterium]